MIQPRTFARIVLVVTLLMASTSLVADVICRLEYIDGFASEYQIATNILGKSVTRDPDLCEVYITKTGDTYYIQSNFVSSEAEYPTKIATRDPVSLADIFANIYAASDEQFNGHVDLILDKYENTVRFYIDQHVFTDSSMLEIDPGFAKNIYVILDRRPPPLKLATIEGSEDGPYLAELKSAVFAKVTPTLNKTMINYRLSNKGFSEKDLIVSSLISDTAVDQALSDSGLIQRKLKEVSDEDLSSLVAGCKGKCLVILGHVESDKMVVRDVSGQNVLYSTDLDDINELGKKFDCNLMVLGCSSAKADVAVGANKPFNPIDVIHRLAVARKAKNYSEFLSLTSSDEMGVVLDQSAFEADSDTIVGTIHRRASELASGGFAVGATMVGLVSIAPGIDLVQVNGTSADGGVTVEREPKSTWIALLVLIFILAAIVLINIRSRRKD